MFLKLVKLLVAFLGPCWTSMDLYAKNSQRLKVGFYV